LGWLGDSDAANSRFGVRSGVNEAFANQDIFGPGSEREAAALFALALAGSAFRFADEEEIRQHHRPRSH
jgi:hypothetical protein